jgi:hypothetical protein
MKQAGRIWVPQIIAIPPEKMGVAKNIYCGNFRNKNPGGNNVRRKGLCNEEK